MIIAIDGHSACGKSTLAKDLAKELGITHIDSGAMYRAATLYFRKLNILPNDLEGIRKNLSGLEISMVPGETCAVLLNGDVVTESIRASDINDWVSDYAKIPDVRRKLVELQRSMANRGSVVMDGRDIGSVVFPNATIKFFLTADIRTRTNRRVDELRTKGIDVSFEAVKANLIRRDHIDSTREDSPLVRCDDAIVIDNSTLDRAEQQALALRYIAERIPIH
ncbi:MAG: (d)CMP kinase [Saprospiraceae bacterium]|nr:(d)CMP kinase [Saprospiraceae bacterium]